MFKTIACIVVVLMLGLFLTGCLSSSDQLRLDALGEKLLKYEQRADTIYLQVRDGTLSVNDAKSLVGQIDSDIESVRKEIDRLQESGYTSQEVFLGILQTLAAVGLSLGGVKVWRGGITERKGVT